MASAAGALCWADARKPLPAAMAVCKNRRRVRGTGILEASSHNPICLVFKAGSSRLLTFDNLPQRPRPTSQSGQEGAALVKILAPVAAVWLLSASGCGFDAKRPNDGEVRHPSNAMTPPEKPPEPTHKEPLKKVAVRRSKPARRPPALEDPRKIPTGIDYSEMVRRFGPPNVRVTDSPTRTTFSYSRLKTQVQVEVQNGKVVAVAAVNTGF